VTLARSGAGHQAHAGAAAANAGDDTLDPRPVRLNALLDHACDTVGLVNVRALRRPHVDDDPLRVHVGEEFRALTDLAVHHHQADQ
jgi:hypothetical protein